MTSLVEKIKDHFFKEREGHEKTSFWCSESELDKFEIYHRFKGTPESNPMTVEKRFDLGVRKKLEEVVVDALDNAGIVEWPSNGDQWRVEMERDGVLITGYMDAIVNEEEDRVPVEIKTSYGPYAKSELEAGQPKLAYLKQLAMYMDSIKAKKGYIFQVHFKKDLKHILMIDGIYQFTLNSVGTDGYKLEGTDIQFNISDTYERFAEINEKYIKPDIEPDPDYIYKYDIDKVDWKKLEAYKRTAALNNRAVVGDWQPKYSNYKDLILAKQDTESGYTEEELNKIAQYVAR